MKWLIQATKSLDMTAVVEADTEEEAWEKGLNLDSEDFEEDGDGSWSTWGIVKLEEDKWESN